MQQIACLARFIKLVLTLPKTRLRAGKPALWITTLSIMLRGRLRLCTIILISCLLLLPFSSHFLHFFLTLSVSPRCLSTGFSCFPTKKMYTCTRHWKLPCKTANWYVPTDGKTLDKLLCNYLWIPNALLWFFKSCFCFFNFNFPKYFLALIIHAPRDIENLNSLISVIKCNDWEVHFELILHHIWKFAQVSSLRGGKYPLLPLMMNIFYFSTMQFVFFNTSTSGKSLQKNKEKKPPFRQVFRQTWSYENNIFPLCSE